MIDSAGSLGDIGVIIYIFNVLVRGSLRFRRRVRFWKGGLSAVCAFVVRIL